MKKILFLIIFIYTSLSAAEISITFESDTDISDLTFFIDGIHANPMSPCLCPKFTIPESCLVQIAVLTIENDTLVVSDPEQYKKGNYQIILSLSDAQYDGVEYYLYFIANSIKDKERFYSTKYKFYYFK